MLPAPQKPIVHLELHTGDLGRARAFYGDLCGWSAEHVDVGDRSYLALGLGEALSGGAVQCAIRHPLWLPYVRVEAVAEATERARRLGAAILLDCREGPAGWRSVVRTAAGGEVALWQPKR